jgi:hypothetical protein
MASEISSYVLGTQGPAPLFAVCPTGTLQSVKDWCGRWEAENDENVPYSWQVGLGLKRTFLQITHALTQIAHDLCSHPDMSRPSPSVRTRSSSVEHYRSSTSRAVSSSEALFQRSMQHARRKQEWLASQANAKLQAELSQCTFSPTINKRAQRQSVPRHRSTVRSDTVACFALGEFGLRFRAHSLCAMICSRRQVF